MENMVCNVLYHKCGLNFTTTRMPNVWLLVFEISKYSRVRGQWFSFCAFLSITKFWCGYVQYSLNRVVLMWGSTGKPKKMWFEFPSFCVLLCTCFSKRLFFARFFLVVWQCFVGCELYVLAQRVANWFCLFGGSIVGVFGSMRHSLFCY